MCAPSSLESWYDGRAHNPGQRMNYGIETAQTIPVDRIFLDQRNLRHEPFEDQEAVIEYLCRGE